MSDIRQRSQSQYGVWVIKEKGKVMETQGGDAVLGFLSYLAFGTTGMAELLALVTRRALP